MIFTIEVSTPELAEAIADKLHEKAGEAEERRKERLHDYYIRERRSAGGEAKELHAIAAAIREKVFMEWQRRSRNEERT